MAMIVPSRWFTGGKGLDDFRDRMIADRRMRAIVDNPKLFDCFPGVEIKGGVNYFLWDRDHDGDCEFSTRIDGQIISTDDRATCARATASWSATTEPCSIDRQGPSAKSHETVLERRAARRTRSASRSRPTIRAAPAEPFEVRSP